MAHPHTVIPLQEYAEIEALLQAARGEHQHLVESSEAAASDAQRKIQLQAQEIARLKDHVRRTIHNSQARRDTTTNKQANNNSKKHERTLSTVTR